VLVQDGHAQEGLGARTCNEGICGEARIVARV